MNQNEITENQDNKKGLNLNAKSFVTAIVVVLMLMIATYLLTFIIPSGTYERIIENGETIIVADSYTEIEGGITFFQFLFSPLLVLGADGSTTIIAIIIFLLVIGGIFQSLDVCGLMKYMLDKIVHKYKNKRYQLIVVISLFFMALGSFIGSFEECVPLVPIVVAIAVSLGWDAITGLAMSLLAAGCGFAAGVCNPFTVGVAQELAGLEMFSGIGLRIVAFLCIYSLLLLFIFTHVKILEKKNKQSKHEIKSTYIPDNRLDRGLTCFAGILTVGILLILSSSFVPIIQSLTMPIIALVFLIAGISASLVSGMSGKELGKTFVQGMLGIAPAILMILMASSIKYILTEANLLDTLLYYATNSLQDLPPMIVILCIYLIVLITNFFIPSGSAKAFLLIPLIVPLADMCDISRQLCVMAFAFGDGFSNVFYITNPVLLISLGLADVSYAKWVKWSWKFQFVNLILTSSILVVGYLIGYQ